MVIVLSVILVSFFAVASHYNYPGGLAMNELHANIELNLRQVLRPRQEAHNRCSAGLLRPVRVHLNVLGCVSGITRFLLYFLTLNNHLSISIIRFAERQKI